MFKINIFLILKKSHWRETQKWAHSGRDLTFDRLESHWMLPIFKTFSQKGVLYLHHVEMAKALVKNLPYFWPKELKEFQESTTTRRLERNLVRDWARGGSPKFCVCTWIKFWASTWTTRVQTDSKLFTKDK